MDLLEEHQTLSRSQGHSNPTLSLGSKVKVVPKGLRSFDEHDADFFLELLPGARSDESFHAGSPSRPRR